MSQGTKKIGTIIVDNVSIDIFDSSGNCLNEGDLFFDVPSVKDV